MGSQPHPSANKLPKVLPGTQPASNLTQRQNPNLQSDKNQFHLPVGRHQSHQEAYSKPPYQLQPQGVGGQTSEPKGATTLLSAKRRSHQKSIQNEKAENYDSVKEEKAPEKQLSDVEIINLHKKDFRLMIVKMIQDLGNKLEAKIDKLQETLSKEIEDLKIKQAEMQNTVFWGFFVFWSFCLFLGPLPRHREVPRLGVK